MRFAGGYDLEDRKPQVEDHDYLDAPNFSQLSCVMHAAYGYIGSYVVQMTKRWALCDEYLAVLLSDNMNGGGRLLKKKNHGGLIKLYDDVVKVCKAAE